MSLCSEMRSRTSASLSATATEGSFAFRGHVAAKWRGGSEARFAGRDSMLILWLGPKWCQDEAGCEPADGAGLALTSDCMLDAIGTIWRSSERRSRVMRAR